MKVGTLAGKESEFARLVQEVKACTKCPRMMSSERVLSHACGGLSAKIMFIGEAPGRRGADISLIPFHGDQAGHNFESLIDGVGISRYESFVTNAVLCNPRDENGNNSTPNKDEIRNCSSFLKRQIDLVQPDVVVTLGGTALKASATIDFHGLDLVGSVRSAKTWYGRKLIPAYHPGQRAMIHRSFANQLADYHFIAEVLRRGDGVKQLAGKKIIKPTTIALVQAIISQVPRLTYFALHKLFFLVEHEALRKLGRRITNSYIIRQKDGPYCVDLHIAKLKKTFPLLDVENRRGKIYISMTPPGLFSDDTLDSFGANEVVLISNIVARYGAMSDAELKKCAYLTSEMRRILRAERQSGRALINAPLLG